jgi:hypothetical protein
MRDHDYEYDYVIVAAGYAGPGRSVPPGRGRDPRDALLATSHPRGMLDLWMTATC